MDADLRFWFDPVCPFAWLASRWVHEVAEQRSYSIEWRLVSLRLLNADVDYAAHFPRGYEEGHTAGLQLLRVCASVREGEGNDAVGRLYTALGERIWEVEQPDSQSAHRAWFTAGETIEQALTEAGASTRHAGAFDDATWDEAVAEDTRVGLSLTGEDVGTPLIQVDPPQGTGFFGPVISRVPRGEEAVALWDHLVALTAFDGFAELKRSLRDRPQLRSTGWTPDDEPAVEDWHAGSRAADRPDGA